MYTQLVCPALYNIYNTSPTDCQFEFKFSQFVLYIVNLYTIVIINVRFLLLLGIGMGSVTRWCLVFTNQNYTTINALDLRFGIYVGCIFNNTID